MIASDWSIYFVLKFQRILIGEAICRCPVFKCVVVLCWSVASTQRCIPCVLSARKLFGSDNLTRFVVPVCLVFFLWFFSCQLFFLVWKCCHFFCCCCFLTFWLCLFARAGAFTALNTLLCLCLLLANTMSWFSHCPSVFFLFVYSINWCFFVLFKLRFFALESGVLQILFARSIPPPLKSFADSPFPFTSNTFCAVYSPPIKQFLRGPFSLPPNYFLRGSCPIPPIFFVRFIPPSLI